MILPLKCLEREVRLKAKDYEKKGFFFEAITAEKAAQFIERLPLEKRKNLLIVLDEVHLWNFWGDDFRPRLWECFYYLAGNGFDILGLTATLRESYKQNWTDLFEWGGYDFSFLDFGNGELVNLPVREESYFGFKKSQLRRRISFEIDAKRSCLIFCQYREEVFDLEKFLLIQSPQLRILTCVGGEGGKFSEALEKAKPAQVIISTSTLSHGVNLGKIERVILTYEVCDWDIYLQMKARGGRGGEDFQVICKQRDKSTIYSKIKLMLLDRYLSLFYA
ncbi:MAG: superfamily II DNA helicase RecQ [Bacteriovoracaceae bacterium]|jgi:superfamily II DNA helicase RecQ